MSEEKLLLLLIAFLSPQQLQWPWTIVHERMSEAHLHMRYSHTPLHHYHNHHHHHLFYMNTSENYYYQ